MKKLSKRLLAMLLVAVMVAAAIPFGAFADPSHTGHDESTASWVYDPDRSDEITPGDGVSVNDPVNTGTHPVICSNCTGTKATGAVYHTYSAEGVCTGCGYDARYTIVITGEGQNITKKTLTNISVYSVADAVGAAGVTGLNIHDGHTIDGTGLAATKSYDAATRTLTLTLRSNAHNLVVTGLTADKSQHTVKCGISECAHESTIDHRYSLTTGVCEVTGCTEKNPDFAKAYAVSVKTEGGIQVAGGSSKNMTEGAAEALKTANSAAIKSFIETVYPTVAADLTDNNLNGATVAVNHEEASILITLKSFGGSSSQPTPTPANQILVIYDDGNTRTINRDINVGTWYFASSNLGLSNTWGTKQAILKIEDANGLRYVSWGSKDSDAYIKATDSTVWVLGNNKTVTIYYLKSSTSNPTTTNAHATKKYEFNTQLGTLPDLPAGYNAWYVDGVQLTENTVYDWESDYVYAYPGKGDGDGRVHLFIYNNNKQLMKNVDVTDNVQSNGLLTRDGLLKTIEYQTGYKNPALAGLFTESGWAYYLNNNKSTRYAQTSISVGTAGERQGTQNIYVVLTGVSGGSNADSSNPKTGDNAMLGTAAIVMALAVVGLGTVFFMKKRERI